MCLMWMHLVLKQQNQPNVTEVSIRNRTCRNPLHNINDKYGSRRTNPMIQRPDIKTQPPYAGDHCRIVEPKKSVYVTSETKTVSWNCYRSNRSYACIDSSGYATGSLTAHAISYAAYEKNNYMVIAKISSPSNLQTTVANIIPWTDLINLKHKKKIL